MSKRLALRRPRMPTRRLDANTRRWLTRIVLSLAAALLAGALAFLVARAIGGVLLFAQQQELLREASGAFQGGILGLAEGNLRAVRLRVQQFDANNQQLSLLIGFVVAALAAVASYLWMERRTEARRSKIEDRG
jgi:H+/Cl- antiporter ClcA